MTYNEWTPDNRPVAVDTKKERVHFRCIQCKRIGLEQSRQQLLEKLSHRDLAAFGFQCKLCGRRTEFLTASITSWLDEIYREREKSVYDWYSYKRTILADFHINNPNPLGIASAAWY